MKFLYKSDLEVIAAVLREGIATHGRNAFGYTDYYKVVELTLRRVNIILTTLDQESETISLKTGFSKKERRKSKKL